MRWTILLLAALIALAGCSGSEMPDGVPAPALSASHDVAVDMPLAPVEPDFDVTRNAFYRDCMQAERDVKACTCTTTTLKDGVDKDTYASMFADGMNAVTRFKGLPAAAVREALTKALKQCSTRSRGG